MCPSAQMRAQRIIRMHCVTISHSFHKLVVITNSKVQARVYVCNVLYIVSMLDTTIRSIKVSFFVMIK